MKEVYNFEGVVSFIEDDIMCGFMGGFVVFMIWYYVYELVRDVIATFVGVKAEEFNFLYFFLFFCVKVLKFVVVYDFEFKGMGKVCNECIVNYFI